MTEKTIALFFNYVHAKQNHRLKRMKFNMKSDLRNINLGKSINVKHRYSVLFDLICQTKLPRYKEAF